MDILHPTDPDGVRRPLTEESSIEQWVGWIQEQPSVKHGVEVLRRLVSQPTPPPGLKDEEPEKKDETQNP
jgi:hypothetical protein